MTKLSRIAFALVAALVAAAASAAPANQINAGGNYSCSFKPLAVQIDKNGNVTVVENSATGWSYLPMCKVNDDANGVSASTCASWVAMAKEAAANPSSTMMLTFNWYDASGTSSPSGVSQNYCQNGNNNQWPLPATLIAPNVSVSLYR